jgi:hypothetical protein
VGYPCVDAHDCLRHYTPSAICCVRRMGQQLRPTPAGKNEPDIVMPGSGTTRHSGRPVEGWILIASLIHIPRYGNA